MLIPPIIVSSLEKSSMQAHNNLLSSLLLIAHPFAESQVVHDQSTAAFSAGHLCFHLRGADRHHRVKGLKDTRMETAVLHLSRRESEHILQEILVKRLSFSDMNFLSFPRCFLNSWIFVVTLVVVVSDALLVTSTQ